MNKDPGLVVLVLGIPTDMPALLNDRTPGAQLARKTLGKDKTGKAGADD
jgi:hypothetical protein